MAGFFLPEFRIVNDRFWPFPACYSFIFFIILATA